MTEEQEDILSLFGVPGVGAKTFARLVARFGSAAAVFSASDRAILDVEGVGPVILGNLRAHDRAAFLDCQKRLMEKTGAVLLTRGSPGYPPLLDSFASAPPVLFVLGDPGALLLPSIAFVGTRRPTPWGISMTEKLAASAVRAGFSVVSGMAAGIDTAAHRAAIEAGGKTVAVFGCGADHVYPAENRGLSGMIRNSGCVVSHFLMGTAPGPGNFPARNALIVGLSLAVAVIEAPKRSGALITADMALRAKRPLFSAPGNADSPSSEGTNALLGSGALPVGRFEDILRALHGAPATNRQPDTGSSRATSPPRPATRAPARPLPQGVAGAILDALGHGPLQMEALCERLGEPAPVLLSELTLLEMDGFIRQKPGKVFERV